MQSIPYDVKVECIRRMNSGQTASEIYSSYFSKLFDNPQSFVSFKTSIGRWKKKLRVSDELTLDSGTYDGFIAHDATVQVNSQGQVVQAWIKQTAASDLSPEEFIEAIKSSVDHIEVPTVRDDEALDMLEIPLFDMHWGISFYDDYKYVLAELLDLINSKRWEQIIIPFGQDFFHNDSLVCGTTSHGTSIEKVDMQRAVKEGKVFIYSLIDAAIDKANSVKVFYSPGNHDRSTSWMFMQVLLERYGNDIVDDTIAYRKAFSHGSNAIMITHGDSKRATAKNLAHIFPVSFPVMFGKAKIREIHAGHLHHEEEADIFGVMVRHLSSANKTDDWTDENDFVGSIKRFMVFVWGPSKLKAIYYIG